MCVALAGGANNTASFGCGKRYQAQINNRDGGNADLGYLGAVEPTVGDRQCLHRQ